ncbi:hypothetical protein E1B28_002275 [Marasmius oreades]|uniref:Uncharacterized protein n=1 Tax=Marasmius oreades TaxID=181124 RepID=A0A9P7UMY0_9AGAR|nr:uncharacterized protein E1B28_002275 [Marasmius oreades]KAG7086311.1 hypothetical protein E1B28_002275 [Marasmius oreades]
MTLSESLLIRGIPRQDTSRSAQRHSTNDLKGTTTIQLLFAGFSYTHKWSQRKVPHNFIHSNPSPEYTGCIEQRFLHRHSQIIPFTVEWLDLRTSNLVDHGSVGVPDRFTVLVIDDQVSVVLANETVGAVRAIGRSVPNCGVIGIVTDAVSVNLHLHERYVFVIDGPEFPTVVEVKLEVTAGRDSEFDAFAVGDEPVSTTNGTVFGEGGTVGVNVRHCSC